MWPPSRGFVMVYAGGVPRMVERRNFVLSAKFIAEYQGVILHLPTSDESDATWQKVSVVAARRTDVRTLSAFCRSQVVRRCKNAPPSLRRSRPQ